MEAVLFPLIFSFPRNYQTGESCLAFAPTVNCRPADSSSMILFCLFWGGNLLALLVGLLCEPGDPRFEGDKLIYRS